MRKNSNPVVRPKLGRRAATDLESRDRRTVELSNEIRTAACTRAALAGEQEPTWTAIAKELIDHCPSIKYSFSHNELAAQWTRAIKTASRPRGKEVKRLPAERLIELENAAIAVGLLKPAPPTVSDGLAAALAAAEKRRQRVAILALRLPKLVDLAQKTKAELELLLRDDHCAAPLNWIELRVWPGIGQLEINYEEFPMVPVVFSDCAESGIPVAWLSNVAELIEHLNNPTATGSAFRTDHPSFKIASPEPTPEPIDSPVQIRIKAAAQRKADARHRQEIDAFLASIDMLPSGRAK